MLHVQPSQRKFATRVAQQYVYFGLKIPKEPSVTCEFSPIHKLKTGRKAYHLEHRIVRKMLESKFSLAYVPRVSFPQHSVPIPRYHLPRNPQNLILLATCFMMHIVDDHDESYFTCSSVLYVKLWKILIPKFNLFAEQKGSKNNLEFQPRCPTNQNALVYNQFGHT